MMFLVKTFHSLFSQRQLSLFARKRVQKFLKIRSHKQFCESSFVKNRLELKCPALLNGNLSQTEPSVATHSVQAFSLSFQFKSCASSECSTLNVVGLNAGHIAGQWPHSTGHRQRIIQMPYKKSKSCLGGDGITSTMIPWHTTRSSSRVSESQSVGLFDRFKLEFPSCMLIIKIIILIQIELPCPLIPADSLHTEGDSMKRPSSKESPEMIHLSSSLMPFTYSSVLQIFWEE